MDITKTSYFQQLDRDRKKTGAWEAKLTWVELLLKSLKQSELDPKVGAETFNKKAEAFIAEVAVNLSELMSADVPSHHQVLAYYFMAAWGDVFQGLMADKESVPAQLEDAADILGEKNLVRTYYDKFISKCEKNPDYLEDERFIPYLRTAIERLREIYPSYDTDNLDALNKMAIVTRLDETPEKKDTRTLTTLDREAAEFQYKSLRHSNEKNSLVGKDYVDKLLALLEDPELTTTLRAKIYNQVIKSCMKMAADQGDYQPVRMALDYVNELTTNPEIRKTEKAVRIDNIFNNFNHLYSEDALFKATLGQYLTNLCKNFNVHIFEKINQPLEDLINQNKSLEETIKPQLHLLRAINWIVKARANGRMSHLKLALKEIQPFYEMGNSLINNYVENLKDITSARLFYSQLEDIDESSMSMVEWVAAAVKEQLLHRKTAKREWVKQEVNSMLWPNEIVNNLMLPDLGILNEDSLEGLIQQKVNKRLKADAEKIVKKMEHEWKHHPIEDRFSDQPVSVYEGGWNLSAPGEAAYVRAKNGWSFFSAQRCSSNSDENTPEASASVGCRA